MSQTGSDRHAHVTSHTATLQFHPTSPDLRSLKLETGRTQEQGRLARLKATGVVHRAEPEAAGPWLTVRILSRGGTRGCRF